MWIKSFDRINIFLCVLFLLIILQPFSNLYAQTPQFTVISIKGNIELVPHQADNTNNQIHYLKTAEKLDVHCEIVLNENSYIALAYSSGAVVELKRPGRYSLSNMASSMNKAGSGISKRLSEYLISEMLETEKSHAMKSVAAVVRQSRNLIDTDFPSETSVIDSIITFRWYKNKGISKYYFRLINPQLNTVLLKEVVDTSYTLNISELELKPGTCYKWYVFNPDDENCASDSSCIVILSEGAARAIEDTLRELSYEMKNSDFGLNNMILAVFYEREGLYLNALECYMKALESAPDVDQYQIKFFRFLLASGLNRKALDFQKIKE